MQLAEFHNRKFAYSKKQHVYYSQDMKNHSIEKTISCLLSMTYKINNTKRMDSLFRVISMN
ncbi:hypothetical protein MADA3029_940030 [Vibrio nigripulchritudo MADA3029]|nr:hypothetical protein VIBNIMADA3020_910030 [Vibrio nigripulchritudo MADA3020]CCN52321.1 hypothetical protein VIBNIMADA3021_1230030 [Vibrio nigripulchritudo MADA3021]CCN62147.1 hypothetical protein MADA3029_940030 [Vibrio nigripulchritudo MADA3029]